MNYNSLEKHLSSEQLEPIYLFYGEEEYLISNSIKKIKKKFGELLKGINYIILDENSISELISNIESPAFGYDKKLILVYDSKIFKKDGRKKTLTPIQEKILNYIRDNYEIIKESVTIIFRETEVDKNDIFLEIDKKAVVCEFPELKPIEIIARLKKICTAYEVKVIDNTLQYLIEVSGTNLQNLINEIRKLIEYKGAGNTIEKKDIDLLAIKQTESIIFDLTDNLALKNIGKSIEILDNLIYQKEPVQKILVTLYNHFKKLYLYTMAVKSNQDVITALNLKPNQTFLVNKYKNQVRHFTNENLRKLLEELANLDYLSKNGKMDLEVGLRSLLCYYCS